jgi:drug/metabolite transporter (DMT)-like permease
MPLSAFALALGAAVLHAFWNLLLARARDVESATAVALVSAVIVFAPVAALRWELDDRVWPYLAVTSALQLLYFALLGTAYRRAELSFVYPLARGLAPVIVLLAGVIVLDETASAAQAAGVVLVGTGVLLVRGLRGGPRLGDALLAVAVACSIASYTLVDKHGIQYADPVVYLELSMAPAAALYAAAVVLLKGMPRVRAEARPASVAAGLASFAAYVLVLAALERASAASVAAVRETSVVIATALASRVLSERVGPTRIAGAVLVVAGVALLGLE